jgi:hypothetical protein
MVQAFESSQGTVLLILMHPEAGLHPSVVQMLPSSQFGAAPPIQAPPPQMSAVVQKLPSSQGSVLAK